MKIKSSMNSAYICTSILYTRLELNGTFRSNRTLCATHCDGRNFFFSLALFHLDLHLFIVFFFNLNKL